MRRVIRIVWNLVAVLSLGMAVIVSGLSLRSYWLDFGFVGTTNWFGGTVGGVEGESIPTGDEFVIGFNNGRFVASFREQVGDVANSASFDVGPSLNDRLPFIWHSSNGADSETVIHGYFLAAFFAAAPGYQLISWLRRGRGPGLCPTCGYDLRASPERCSECGTVAGTVNA